MPAVVARHSLASSLDDLQPSTSRRAITVPLRLGRDSLIATGRSPRVSPARGLLGRRPAGRHDRPVAGEELVDRRAGSGQVEQVVARVLEAASAEKASSFSAAASALAWIRKIQVLVTKRPLEHRSRASAVRPPAPPPRPRSPRKCRRLLLADHRGRLLAVDQLGERSLVMRRAPQRRRPSGDPGSHPEEAADQWRDAGALWPPGRGRSSTALRARRSSLLTGLFLALGHRSRASAASWLIGRRDRDHPRPRWVISWL